MRTERLKASNLRDLWEQQLSQQLLYPWLFTLTWKDWYSLFITDEYVIRHSILHCSDQFHRWLYTVQGVYLLQDMHTYTFIKTTPFRSICTCTVVRQAIYDTCKSFGGYLNTQNIPNRHYLKWYMADTCPVRPSIISFDDHITKIL